MVTLQCHKLKLPAVTHQSPGANKASRENRRKNETERKLRWSERRESSWGSLRVTQSVGFVGQIVPCGVAGMRNLSASFLLRGKNGKKVAGGRCGLWRSFKAECSMAWLARFGGFSRQYGENAVFFLSKWAKRSDISKDKELGGLLTAVFTGSYFCRTE